MNGFNARYCLFYLCATLIIFQYGCDGKKKDSSLTKDFIDKEKKDLNSKGIECGLKKLLPRSLDNLRLTNTVDKSIPCYLKAVEENTNDGWLWSVLASLYTQKESHSQASNCYKIAAKTLGRISPFIDTWYFIGPWIIGKIELDGDPLDVYGGIQNVSRFRFKKQEKFVSELLPGAEIKWSTHKQNYGGQQLRISPSINWNDLVTSLGSMGITEWQGWIVGEFAVNEKDLNVIIQCLGVHTVYVDNIPLTGDVYHREQFWSGISLPQGIHTIYIRLRTKVSANFVCSLKVAPSIVHLHKPHYLPDLINGFLFSKFITFPVSNYHHMKWVKITKVTIADQTQEGQIKVKLYQTVRIAPGQTLPLILVLSAKDKVVSKCREESSYIVEFKITTSEGTYEISIKLRCRRIDQSFLYTFLDHDGSVQHAAGIQPIKSCETNVCPVLLTLHGTTVPPQNQADSYKRMEGGDYVFGADHAWLLAPTRHGAHNWEGPGALTAMHSLDALQKMVEKSDIFSQKVDANRVVFAGHSMGGHGSWHLATHFPDRALAVISLAGWIKKEEYGDSNLFFRHDISTSHVDPITKYIMESCIAENDADRHVSNIKDIPVLARIGAEDKTVHPFYIRRMYRLLSEIGVNVNYTEITGKEHWWWDTWETNDGGAVNDPQLRDFTNKYTVLKESIQCQNNGKGGCKKSGENKYAQKAQSAREFTLTVYNPAFGEGLNGIRVLQQLTPFRKSMIKGVIESDTISLTTLNVAMFSIQEPSNRPISWSHKTIKINGKENVIKFKESDDKVNLCLTSGEWKVCTGVEDSERGPETYGPARRIAEKEFIIVTGTQSTNSSHTNMLLQSAVYIANLFLLTSDTVAPVVKDTDVDISDSKNYILLGSPQENLHAAVFMEKLPFFYSNTEKIIGLGSCLFNEDRTGFLSLAPHGDSHLAMLIFGSSLQGLKDVVSLTTPTIPPMTRSPFSNLIPDYVITGPEFGWKGPGGFLCTGFYGNRWEYRQDMSSCIC